MKRHCPCWLDSPVLTKCQSVNHAFLVTVEMYRQWKRVAHYNMIIKTLTTAVLLHQNSSTNKTRSVRRACLLFQLDYDDRFHFRAAKHWYIFHKSMTNPVKAVK